MSATTSAKKILEIEALPERLAIEAAATLLTLPRDSASLLESATPATPPTTPPISQGVRGSKRARSDEAPDLPRKKDGSKAMHLPPRVLQLAGYDGFVDLDEEEQFVLIKQWVNEGNASTVFASMDSLPFREKEALAHRLLFVGLERYTPIVNRDGGGAGSMDDLPPYLQHFFIAWIAFFFGDLPKRVLEASDDKNAKLLHLIVSHVCWDQNYWKQVPEVIATFKDLAQQGRYVPKSLAVPLKNLSLREYL